MRIKAIRLEWFRGAGPAVELAVKGKSAVVYGANGAGKSSFVDGLEYMLCDGKVGHLSHEYSGRKQEKGVINTHKPTLEPTTVTIEFRDRTAARVIVQASGVSSLQGDGVAHLKGLDYRRLVLRQDEVAAFISSAKGEKYSALLPLLGLEGLEAGAEAIRQLAKRVERRSGLSLKQQELKELQQKAGGRYHDNAALADTIARVHGKYRLGEAREPSLLDDCRYLQRRIRERLEAFTPDVRRHEALRRLADHGLDEIIKDVVEKREALAGASIKLLRERIDISAGLEQWLAKTTAEISICPACGQQITERDLRSHFELEKRVLESERILLEQFKAAVDALRNCIASIESAAKQPFAREWLELEDASAAERLGRLAELRQLAGDSLVSAQSLADVTDHVLPLVRMAGGATQHAPPETRELLEDFEAAGAGEAFLCMPSVLSAIRGINRAAVHLGAVERSIRDAIREQADRAIAEISGDIQRMWGILHPGKEIKDVKLKHPDETDKAIDIELTFFGVELKSPRLTLSEGNRNSLGLCVFLAMALRAQGDQPVVLDDVVVSLDREHRGMIVDLLEREFANRQVILFTHDRDWFAELRQFLDKGWQHLALRPYRGPQDGIAWSTHSAGFDDARALLSHAPDAAGNTARKIMDTELAIVAERLRVPMEYRQGLKNEHRMAHDFLIALAKASEMAFQRRSDKGDYVKSDDVATLFRATDKLVVAWGNRGSHSFDVTFSEATKLIGQCELALGALLCAACGQSVGKLEDASAESKQCGCGAVRWRYGKLR